MATIENFATVRFTSGGVTGTAVSNLAQIQLESSVTLTKSALSATYREDDTLTYILTVQNTSGAPLTNLRIEDDLGTFPFGTSELTPLTYGGDALLLIDGQDSTAQLVVDASTPSALSFTVPTLAAGATANVVYNAVVNEFASPELNATILNSATLTSDAECATGTASATVTAVEGASIRVLKQMSPNPAVCGNPLTYSIRIFNDGNIPAENVQVTDAFDPAPANVTVTRNGTVLPATGYTYVNGLLTVPPTGTAGDTVPAATYVRDPETGAVTVIPGTVEYIVTGTI